MLELQIVTAVQRGNLRHGQRHDNISGSGRVGVAIQGANIGVVTDGRDVTVNGIRTMPTAPATEIRDEVAKLRAQVGQPGPRLALLTKGEAGAVYAMLAVVAGISPELDAVAEELANRLSARIKEHEA